MKEDRKNIIGLGFSIFMLIIVLISIVYTGCILNEKSDIRIAEKRKRNQ